MAVLHVCLGGMYLTDPLERVFPYLYLPSLFMGTSSASCCISAFSYTFLCCEVCLSVCHACALYLSHSTDLDAIWQIHLWAHGVQ